MDCTIYISTFHFFWGASKQKWDFKSFNSFFFQNKCLVTFLPHSLIEVVMCSGFKCADLHYGLTAYIERESMWGLWVLMTITGPEGQVSHSRSMGLISLTFEICFKGMRPLGSCIPFPFCYSPLSCFHLVRSGTPFGFWVHNRTECLLMHTVS